jgi:Heterokaryon incompatibility protein (HET)
MGNGQHGQYVTLSYKSGDCRKFSLSTHNYLSYLNGISLQTLPRTFKEAMQVTICLGFRYLWIDALCILQDSKDGLQREISSMDKIHRHSALTIFAAGGDDADSGLSVSRDPRWTKPCKSDLKTTAGNQFSQGSLYVFLRYNGNENRPLYERGWVLKEEILSTRALVFSSRQLSWWCLCGEAAEEMPGHLSVQGIIGLGTYQDATGQNYSLGFDGFNGLRFWLQERGPMPNRALLHRDNQFDRWYEMVTEYTLRSLTYKSDILPGPSGLASAMTQTHGCTYLAGLWKEDLQIGRAWYVRRPDINDIDRATTRNTHHKSINIPT